MKTTITIGLVLAALRVLFVFDEPGHHVFVSFQAAAHLFMGGLAVAWWNNRVRWSQVGSSGMLEWNTRQPWQWRLFWAMNVVEVASAVFSRVG